MYLCCVGTTMIALGNIELVWSNCKERKENKERKKEDFVVLVDAGFPP